MIHSLFKTYESWFNEWTHQIYEHLEIAESETYFEYNNNLNFNRILYLDSHKFKDSLKI